MVDMKNRKYVVTGASSGIGLATARMLTDAGLFTNPVIAPAVAPGEALIRTSYTAAHTDEHLDRVLDIFEQVGKKTGVI